MQTLIRSVSFQFLPPSKFVAELKKPQGINVLLPDDKKMRLTVQGEKEAVELVAQLAKLADVRPLRYQLELLLVRLGPGTRREVLEKKTLLLTNKEALAVNLGNGACELAGTLHGSPAEVQLVFEAKAFRVGGGRRVGTESVQSTRRVPFGKPLVVARFSDPATGPRQDKKPTPITLVVEASASEATGRPER